MSVQKRRSGAELLARVLREVVARLKTAWFNRRINRAAGLHHSGETASGRQPPVTVFLALKVVDRVRLNIFGATLKTLEKALSGSQIDVLLRDASERDLAAEVEIRAAASSLSIDYKPHSAPMAPTFATMMQECSTEYCYLQFDDMITTNLSPHFLSASCKLLQKYEGLVNVVTTTWPVDVNVDDATQTISVATYVEEVVGQKRCFSFDGVTYHAPVVIDEVDGMRFAIFENFYYGLYFNNVVAPVRDYARRLWWYMEKLQTEQVHEIEVAASRRKMGPIWLHFAVCLEGVAILDIDFKHTAAAVRKEVPDNRRYFDALQRGYRIDAFPRVLEAQTGRKAD